MTEPQKDILKEISTDPEWKLEVSDEFENNKNGWEIGPYQNDSLTLERKIENGKYIWEYESKSGWNFWDCDLRRAEEQPQNASSEA